MKRKELNSVAASLCAYLCSRNNDIVGYWGIGKLCLIARLQKKKSFSFKVRPGEVLWIYGYEISNSRAVTDKLVKLGLDSIEGRMSFLPHGQFPNGTEKYLCSVTIAVTQDGRTGLSLCHVLCRPHDSSTESRRTG